MSSGEGVDYSYLVIGNRCNGIRVPGQVRRSVDHWQSDAMITDPRQAMRQPIHEDVT